MNQKKRQWLIDLRTKKELTTYEAALQCGISQSFYSSIENGIKGAKLPVPTAMRIAEALGFDWQLFYQDEAPDAQVG